MPLVLVVTPTRTVRETVIGCLQGQPGLDFADAGDAFEAIQRLALEVVDLLVVDLELPAEWAHKIVRLLHEQPRHRCVPVLVLTPQEEAAHDWPLTTASPAPCRVLGQAFAPDEMIETVRGLLGMTLARPAAVSMVS